MDIIGGAVPVVNAILYEMENNAYNKNPVSVINGFNLIVPYTMGVKAYRNDNIIVLAIRGTVDMSDFYADIQIANGSLNNSTRYKEDRNYILNLQQQYPQTEYDYYAVGHSLGGAIIDILLDEGLIKEAVSYNPAVETKYFKNTKNHRIYNSNDPLYKLMGRFTSNPEVRKNKLSTLNTLADFTSVGKLKNIVEAHLLNKFEGGEIHLTADYKRNCLKFNPSLKRSFSF